MTTSVSIVTSLSVLCLQMMLLKYERRGGIIIFFGWSQQPSLLQPGNVFMHIETNAFTADLAHTKSRDVYAEAFTGFELGFLEKSYDDHGWWAKYWLLIRKTESTDK